MVEVTALNGQKMVINGDQIERIEALPDTILSLNSGRKVIVRESVMEIMRLLAAYRRALMQGVLPNSVVAGDFPEFVPIPEPA